MHVMHTCLLSSSAYTHCEGSYYRSYELNTIESLTRQLADFAFLMQVLYSDLAGSSAALHQFHLTRTRVLVQDYELALPFYQLLVGDYKTDKSWRHYASSQEALGICCALTETARRDMSTAFELAITTYHAQG